jgi:hypothetical protein
MTASPARAGDWRVDLRAANGAVLHEARFTVASETGRVRVRRRAPLPIGCLFPTPASPVADARTHPATQLDQRAVLAQQAVIAAPGIDSDALEACNIALAERGPHLAPQSIQIPPLRSVVAHRDLSETGAPQPA